MDGGTYYAAIAASGEADRQAGSRRRADIKVSIAENLVSQRGERDRLVRLRHVQYVGDIASGETVITSECRSDRIGIAAYADPSKVHTRNRRQAGAIRRAAAHAVSV